MTHSTLTSKGETTIPLVIRIAAGIQMGAKLNWSVSPDGVIRVNVKTIPTQALK